MPQGLCVTYQIHRHDCDAYGHLATVQYMQLVEDVSCMPGGSEAGAVTSQRPLRAYFEFLRPLLAGDEVEVTASPWDLSAHFCLRDHVLHRSGAEEPAATSQILWQATPRGGAGLSAGPHNAVLSEPRAQLTVEPPPLPAPPECVFSMERRVLWHDIDPQYRMSFAAYGRFVVDCSIEVGAHFGWSVQRSQEEGIAYVARRLWLEFGEPAALGDDIRISSYVSQLKRSTIVRHYLLERLPSLERIATAHILWVSVDASSGRPIRQPLYWLDDFAGNIVGQ